MLWSTLINHAGRSTKKNYDKGLTPSSRKARFREPRFMLFFTVRLEESSTQEAKKHDHNIDGFDRWLGKLDLYLGVEQGIDCTTKVRKPSRHLGQGELAQENFSFLGPPDSRLPVLLSPSTTGTCLPRVNLPEKGTKNKPKQTGKTTSLYSFLPSLQTSLPLFAISLARSPFFVFSLSRLFLPSPPR